jgi:hypothetical protein
MIYAKIGTKQIAIDEEIGGEVEAVREHLRPTFPEVATAQASTRTDGENTIIEFAAQPGRKG